MMNALIALVVIAIISIAFCQGKNRKALCKIAEARKELQKRALNFEDHSVDDFLKHFDLTGENECGARILLAELADMLKVSPKKLSHNYSVFCIKKLLRQTHKSGLYN